jgi:DNA-binding response OmpR family regulator
MIWTVLCVSNDAPSLLLYESILELEGHCALGVANAGEALKVSERIAVDCILVDCEDNWISVTKQIARAWPEIPILIVSDQLEVHLQVYSETAMFVSKEEAIGELSSRISEVIGRSVYRWEEDPRATRTSNANSRTLHRVFVRWMLLW